MKQAPEVGAAVRCAGKLSKVLQVSSDGTAALIEAYDPYRTTWVRVAQLRPARK